MRMYANDADNADKKTTNPRDSRHPHKNPRHPCYMLILGIETSCDETSVALVEARNSLPAEALAKAGRFVVHKNLVSSQIKIHRKYGGVVPEVAARRHVEVIVPLLKEALEVIEGRHVKRQEIKEITEIKEIGKKIDVIAVTAGPGLVTSLLVGVETARTLAYLWKKPLVAVNHLEGHIYANWLPPVGEISNFKFQISNKSQNPKSKKSKILNLKSKIIFPALCLIVSGGHTELVLMKDHLKYKLIGQTRDDAAGECFDKVGKMLGLPYPGGPEVARLASHGNSQAIHFPRPMMDSPDFNFSFSGLKTAVLYFMKTPHQTRRGFKVSESFLRGNACGSFRGNCLAVDRFGTGQALEHNNTKTIKQFSNLTINDICASFQQAAVDVLVNKTLRAAQKYQVKTILLGGGVAANQQLQQQLELAVKQNLSNTKYFILNTKYCSDNAAMIAAAAYFHVVKKDYTPWQKLKVDPNWELAR